MGELADEVGIWCYNFAFGGYLIILANGFGG
jgi:hypothetical protein